jgi:hypothetical protein
LTLCLSCHRAFTGFKFGPVSWLGRISAVLWNRNRILAAPAEYVDDVNVSDHQPKPEL